MKSLRKYRKFVAVIIGTAAMVLAQKYHIVIPGFAEIYTQMLLSALTAAGVYQVPNDHS